jgi:hypothetical protein
MHRHKDAATSILRLVFLRHHRRSQRPKADTLVFTVLETGIVRTGRPVAPPPVR